MGIGAELGIGDIGLNIAGVGSFVTKLIIFILFAAVLGGIVWFMYNKKMYNKKIQIFEEINGQALPTRQFSAREVAIPNTSIKVYQIKENNMYLPSPTIQTGKDNYIFFIRDDHEWINVGISSLNKQLTELGLKYNHVDMRYANSSLKELIKSNYGESDWLKKYGVYIALGLFVVLAGISLYLVAEKLNTTTGLLDTMMVRNENLMKELVDKAQTSGIKLT